MRSLFGEDNTHESEGCRVRNSASSNDRSSLPPLQCLISRAGTAEDSEAKDEGDGDEHSSG